MTYSELKRKKEEIQAKIERKTEEIEILQIELEDIEIILNNMKKENLGDDLKDYGTDSAQEKILFI